MSLVINHNLMALNAARNLDASYSQLGVSTRRLSSGLRVGTAADDAAGLAIRELMRADVASLNQGMRNANDAVSMIQTADGVLQVIDEKLIRMKELATQAATGTYTSDQRLIIDSEYQAMASEITRIANASEFNGIYLLNGNLASDRHNGSGIDSTGKLKIHFGSGNSSAEDYYYVQIGDSRAGALGVGTGKNSAFGFEKAISAATEMGYVLAMQYGASESDASSLAVALENDVRSYFSAATDYNNHDNPSTGNPYTDPEWVSMAPEQRERLKKSWGRDAALVLAQADYSSPPQGTDVQYPIATGTVDFAATFASATSSLSSNSGVRKAYADAATRAVGDAYRLYTNDVGMTISTQEMAQRSLTQLSSAIVSKDKIRARLGATQNRLQNTIQTLAIQAENLQSAESRISDVDVSIEMTEFVRQQILTQSAVAMLAQANSLPKMAMQLIGG